MNEERYAITIPVIPGLSGIPVSAHNDLDITVHFLWNILMNDQCGFSSISLTLVTSANPYQELIVAIIGGGVITTVCVCGCVFIIPLSVLVVISKILNGLFIVFLI